MLIFISNVLRVEYLRGGTKGSVIKPENYQINYKSYEIEIKFLVSF